MKFRPFSPLLVLFVVGASCAADVPQRLDAVRVGAGVPSVKVADYHRQIARYGAAAVAEGDFLYVIGGGGLNGRTADAPPHAGRRARGSHLCHRRKTRWQIRAQVRASLRM